MINPFSYTTPIMWVGFIAFIAVFVALIIFNFVNKTVGIAYAFKLFQMKKKANKDKVLLKVWLANGKPQYIVKPVANLIEYEYKENGKTKVGMVKYDYYSMYREFSDIPIIECDPQDILPRNPFVNTALTISGEIIKKNITDASKEDLRGEELKKWLKLAVPIIIAVGVVIILYSSNQGDQTLELTRQLANCYAQIPKAATIVSQ